MRAVLFTSARVGWAAGDLGGAVMHTKDGGRVWALQALGGNRQWHEGLVLYDIAFATPSRGWVAGSSGGTTRHQRLAPPAEMRCL